MSKLNKLKKELDMLIEENANYNKVLKKSQEVDKYIVKEMLNLKIEVGS